MTDYTTLVDGTIVAGTQDGKLAIAAAGTVVELHPPNSGGPVSDIVVHPAPPRNKSQGELVSFAVNQGVGIFEPKSQTFIDFGKRPLMKPGVVAPIEPIENFIAEGLYIRLWPDSPRPELDDLGHYSAINKDEAVESLIIDYGISGLCALYVPFVGAVPRRSWCVDLSDIFPPPILGSVPTPNPADRCSADDGRPLDQAHTLTVLAEKGGLSPASLTLNAGETYRIVYAHETPGAAQGLNFQNATGSILRAADGSPLCIRPDKDGKGTLLVTPDESLLGKFVFADPTNESLTGDLVIVAAPPSGPPGSGPESSGVTFSIDTDAAAPGVQTSGSIGVGNTFNVEVTVSSSQAWEAYQITLHYDDTILDSVAPNPDQPWTAAPVEGVRGGNQFSFTTTPAFCTPSTQGASRFREDDAGDAEWAMTCAEATTGTNHTGDGALVQFTFKCEAAGTANLTLTGIADTFLLDAAFTQYNDAQQSATIICQ